MPKMEVMKHNSGECKGRSLYNTADVDAHMVHRSCSTSSIPSSELSFPQRPIIHWEKSNASHERWFAPRPCLDCLCGFISSTFCHFFSNVIYPKGLQTVLTAQSRCWKSLPQVNIFWVIVTLFSSLDLLFSPTSLFPFCLEVFSFSCLTWLMKFPKITSVMGMRMP